MGYQESLISVASPAEAAGIRRAVLESWEKERGIIFFGLERRRRAGDGDESASLRGREMDEYGRVRDECLYAAVGGARSPYQGCCEMEFIEQYVGYSEEVDYFSVFQEVDDACMDEAERRYPQVAETFYEATRHYLEHVWDDERMWSIGYDRLRRELYGDPEPLFADQYGGLSAEAALAPW